MIPNEPGWWDAPAVFPAHQNCTGQPLYGNGAASQLVRSIEDSVCDNTRLASFPNCSLTVVVPHKSASSMVLGQFENICGSPQFHTTIGLKSNGFGFDHRQDASREQHQRRHLAGRTSRTLKALDRRFQWTSLNTTLGAEENPFISTNLFTVLILRDPVERAIGMYKCTHMHAQAQTTRTVHARAHPTGALCACSFHLS